MKVGIYGFYDVKSRSYIGDTAGLVLFRHDAVAMRSFGDLCRQEGSIFAKHPDDYEMHRVGEFDTESGQIQGDGVFVLANAKQVLDT